MAPAALRIFISYRRQDSSGFAGRLYDSLATASPGSELFMDVVTIDPGADVLEVLRDAIGSTDVLIPVIGPRWLDMRDASGGRRLHRADDIVRMEIETAFELGVRVAPVLVDGAVPPSANDLPPTLAALAGLNAVEVRHTTWGRDVQSLADGLERARTGRPASEPIRGGDPARKVVAVCLIATDLEYDDLDPELEDALWTRVRNGLIAIADRYGGVVESGDGASMRLVFGAVQLHEDDAMRALRAALDAADAVAEMSPPGGLLVTRAAVGLGELLVAGRDGAITIRGAALRETNLALRLAKPGEVLLTGDARRALGEKIEAQPLGAGDGVERFVAVAMERPDARRGAASPVVGRQVDRDAIIGAARRAVAESSCQLVTILGDAGIGKSRLVEEASGSSGIDQRFTGSCLAYGDGITFWPIIEIVKQAAGIGEAESSETILEKIEAVFAGDEDQATLSAQIGALLGLSRGGGAPQETLWAIRRLFEVLAAHGPVMVVIEDIHWAEPMLLDLIEEVTDRAHGVALLLVCVARPELLEVRPTWGGGQLNATTITLRPLSAADTQELVENQLPGGAPPGVAELIAETANGNPLFAEQLLGALIDRGALERVNGQWRAAGQIDRLEVPDSIQALLAARVDGLPEQQRDTACGGSVVGRVFYTGALEVLIAPRFRGDVPDQLDGLARRQLIRPDGSTFAARDTFAFVHVLLRDAAYATLPKRERAALHETFATWLEGQVGDGLPEYEEIVGYHREAAWMYRVELGESGEELDRLAVEGGRGLGAAGRRALGRGDVAAASRLLARAVDLLASAPGERLDCAFDLIDALLEQGQLQPAASALRVAEEAARATGSETAHERCFVTGCFVQAHRGNLEVAGLRERAAAAESVFASVADDHGLAQLGLLLADLNMDAGRYAEAVQDLERGLEAAQRAGVAREESLFLTWLASALFWGPTPVSQALGRAREILAGSGTSPVVEAKTRLVLGGLLGLAGEIEEARGEFALSEAIHADLGLGVSLATGRQLFGLAELVNGNVAEAEREFRAGFDALTVMEEHGFAVGAGVYLARALAELRRWDEVDELAAGVRRAAPADDRMAHAHADLLIARSAAHRGDGARMVAIARGAVETLAQTDELLTRADSLVDLSEVLSVSDVPSEARAVLAEAQALCARKEIPGAVVRINKLIDQAA